MNKKRIFTPILMATALVVASHNPSQAALVSLWTLDDTSGGAATDSVGGNNATWQNAGTNLANAAGQIGGAADLTDNGSGTGNNYFQMTIPQLIGATGATFSAWINNDANSGYTGILMTRTFNGQTNNSWGLAIEPGGSNWRLDARLDGPGIDSADDSVVVDGTWKHVALTFDAGTETFTSYLNGAFAATGSTAADAGVGASILGPDSGPWYIGYDDCCGGGRDFDGRIDDVAVWDNALTAGQINTIYQNGLAGTGVTEPGSSMLALFGAAALLFRRKRA